MNFVKINGKYINFDNVKEIDPSGTTIMARYIGEDRATSIIMGVKDRKNLIAVLESISIDITEMAEKVVPETVEPLIKVPVKEAPAKTEEVKEEKTASTNRGMSSRSRSSSSKKL